MNLIEQYFRAFCDFSRNSAFYAGNKNHTYKDFLGFITGSRYLLESQPQHLPHKAIGVVCNEGIETYAAIFAIWFAGCYFVPLQKDSPSAFIKEILKNHNIKYVFSSDPKSIETGASVSILKNSGISSEHAKAPYPLKKNQLLYVLNTSGSTGTPKNVPINVGNLTAFVEGFMEIYPELEASDNFLQTYELTADAAFTGYLIPFLIGATVYTVPRGTFKPFAVAKILKEHPITWTQVTPSLLSCLQPFFDSFYLEDIKHFHFGGEALPVKLVEDWRKCVPKAEISNVYGPTETSITATIYKCLPNNPLLEFKGIISIGKPLRKVEAIIDTTQGNEGTLGELLLAGEQLMESYLFTNRQPFKYMCTKKGESRFYPTGDMVKRDGQGNYYFLGRVDEQVKINGFRIDLVEIEKMVRAELESPNNVAAVAFEHSPGLKKLLVFIENYSGDETILIRRLASKYLPYKIPEKIIEVPSFPLSQSGKTDKKALVSKYYSF